MSKASKISLFFYQVDMLVTVEEGGQHRTIFRSAKLPLAEQQEQGEAGPCLFATDDKGSVLRAHDDEPDHAFTAYGHNPAQQKRSVLLGFNGERFNAASTSYDLGNGYRAYSPALMRFRSPDQWSPFGRGGLNYYAYCNGDPLNYSDPSGHAPPPKRPSLPSLMKNRIVRLFNVEHYETSKTGRVETVGKDNEAVSRSVTSTRRTLRTTEIFEVSIDPYKGPNTTYVTRTNLDQYLEISNTLHAAELVNALGDPKTAVSSAYMNNLENRRQGLTLYGRSLAERATDPLDLTAYLQGTFRVSRGASELRSK